MEPRQALKWARAKFLSTAAEIIKDPKKVLNLVSDVEGKINTDFFKKQFKTFWSDLKTLLSLLKDAARGRYKAQSKKSLILMVLALLYFLSPLDLIPDLLIGGFIDDAALIAWVITKVKDEIDNYEAWRASQGS